MRADDKGILPDRMIAKLVETGAIIPATALDEGFCTASTAAIWCQCAGSGERICQSKPLSFP